MDQADPEAKPPGPDGNEVNKQRRSSIELKKLEAGDSAKEPSFSRPEVIFKGDKSPGNWMACLKCSLIILNSFIWILGAAITGIGIWMAVDKEFWTLRLNLEIKMFNAGIYVGIAVGVIILIIGLIGCIGSWKENTCLLVTFGVIILLLVVLEAAAMGIVWSATHNNSKLREHFSEYIKKGVNTRYEDDSVRYFVDLLQSKLKCCGVEDDEEFGEDSLYPDSCKNLETGFAYEEGCLSAAIKYLKSKAGMLGGLAASVFALQLGTLSLTVCLCCGLRQAKKNIF